jgi:hypothetical protein
MDTQVIMCVHGSAGTARRLLACAAFQGKPGRAGRDARAHGKRLRQAVADLVVLVPDASCIRDFHGRQPVQVIIGIIARFSEGGKGIAAGADKNKCNERSQDQLVVL